MLAYTQSLYRVYAKFTRSLRMHSGRLYELESEVRYLKSKVYELEEEVRRLREDVERLVEEFRRCIA